MQRYVFILYLAMQFHFTIYTVIVSKGLLSKAEKVYIPIHDSPIFDQSIYMLCGVFMFLINSTMTTVGLLRYV